ncbi:ICln family transporter: chloride ion current inducer protein I(Cln) [Dorcoceras hygrometricum]|uniref:ICln family transporter: chloride ion current inducer protein I(Cln) n=1 Tax=Dorcoceras hygrometricum TaxID=472368 RepID=A0A2Z7CNV6_9LAMI|nr:ICln family transporter: chloride ion current inducer protein I(Cln) [Dorcoceras hygrometricum]
MNWGSVLFGILKKMVTPGSKQAKGFAIQLSLILESFQHLELGESSEFPPSKILTEKTTHRYIAIIDKSGAQEPADAPAVKKASKKKVASKKRPAADVEAAVPKKKRTVKKKSVSSLSSLELVAVAEEAIPIQQVAEPSAVEEPRCPSADDVDLIIQQVLDETREVEAPVDKPQTAVTKEKHWFDLPYDDLVAQWEAERPVVTASDTDEEIATIDVAPADGDQQVQESVAPISNDNMLSADERMSLEDILFTIPVDIPLPSSCMEITKITMGKSIKIPGVNKWTWFLKSLPRIPAEDKGKEVLVEKDPVKGNPAKEHYSLICADIELLVNLRAHVIDDVAKFFHSFSLKKLATINFEEMYKKEEQAERPVVTASDTDEDITTVDVAPADGDQQVQESVAPISADDMLSDDERMSLDDILLTIPVDIPLPSSSMEIAKITMGKSIKIPGVNKWTWFLQSLPRIPTGDKGKEVLVEQDPVKGNPAEEHYSLICADIELLVNLWAQVIDDVAKFFHSFSLKKLATINFEEMYKKEEQVCTGEKQSLLRANFAPGQGSSAVDIQVIELLSDLYLCFLEELAKEARAHGLTWRKPCCSKIFEGSPRDRGAIIARNNTHTPSRCWIRTMLYVNGEWVVEPCVDRWVKIPKLVISTEVPHQRQYDDTLPTMSVFFKLMTKRWADVCLEIVGFCASQRLLPVGSIQFCRSLQLAEPVSRIAPSRSPVFALRVSQFCSIFFYMSLFNWFPSTDISEFLSSIALDRTVLHSVQSFQNSFSVAPSVQLSLEQQLSSSSSTSSSSSLHFDKTDVDATASSRPPISQDLSAAFADFQAALSEQMFVSQSDISSRLHKIEQSVCDSLRDQADIFRNLSQGARQEARTLDDVQTIRFNEFRKNILAQNASIFVGLADVRKEVEAVNAKVDIMASRLNAIQKDAEATKEALSHQLLEFQSQAQENHNVIHAQLSELVDYIHRGSADKKGESGSRGLQQPASTQIEGSAERPTFAQRVEMAQRHIVQTVLDADANRALFARQDAAERDRERRRREARALKRRRRD